MKPPPQLTFTGPGEPLAHVVRGHLAESMHTGHLLVLDGDSEVIRRGDPDAVVFARSALKPLQAIAALRAGADLTSRQLALACGSHSGLPVHTEVALSTLASVGLDASALQNTPSWPTDSAARTALALAGAAPSPLTQNCSGKHAAMLAACVASGWDPATYRDPQHPLQRAIAATIAELTGEPVSQHAVDGCGAPVFSSTLRGLARAFAALVDAEAGTDAARVAEAMRAHPELVAGPDKLDTQVMTDVDGLLSKGGAEGVLAVALPGPRVVVAKVADGSARPLPVVLARALGALGEQDAWPWARVPVLGHGEPAGSVIAAFEV